MVYYVTLDKSEPRALYVATLTTAEGGRMPIYIAENESTDRDQFKKEAIISKDSGSEIFPHFPKLIEQNHRLMVTGSSGSGKSTVIGRILDQMIKNKPKPTEADLQEGRLPGQIVIFSAIHTDPPLDKQTTTLCSVNSKSITRWTKTK